MVLDGGTRARRQYVATGAARGPGGWDNSTATGGMISGSDQLNSAKHDSAVFGGRPRRIFLYSAVTGRLEIRTGNGIIGRGAEAERARDVM